MQLISGGVDEVEKSGRCVNGKVDVEALGDGCQSCQEWQAMAVPIDPWILLQV
jgi:hypothetical protein